MNLNHCYLGDCRDVMRTLADSSIDSIVCDPPYELGFMGKSWDKSGIAYDPVVWTQCLRLLRPGGHLLAFGGSRTYHRLASAIEDAGFEIRDQIMWIYGSGFPKSHNLEGDWQGWGTALKPAHEPICVARKPLIGTVAANVTVYGTGAINIDACRVPTEPMQPNTGTGALPRRREDDFRGPGIVTQPHELGRWPANIIHDGSDEVIAAFPAAAGQLADAKQSGERKTKNVYGAMRYREPSADRVYESVGGTNFSMKPGARRQDAGGADRFFYCAKASRSDRNEGLNNFQPTVTNDGRTVVADNAYQRGATLRANHHPTVKPTSLMRYLIRLVTPPGGIPLDPFMGSGSTGKAAIREGFRFIGIEKEQAYFDVACARIAYEEERRDDRMRQQSLQLEAV